MRRTMFFCAFWLGAVLMSFEMLASRYLTPYFGGGIITWACLISMVLASVMFGYLLGGVLVDRNPTILNAVAFTFIATVWFGLTPSFASGLLEKLSEQIDSIAVGALVGSAALIAVPVIALGAFSPIAMRLVLRDVSESGKTSGFIYGVSTFGNIVGTLGTALIVIPNMGTNAACYVLSAVTGSCSIVLLVAGLTLEKRLAVPAGGEARR